MHHRVKISQLTQPTMPDPNTTARSKLSTPNTTPAMHASHSGPTNTPTSHRTVTPISGGTHGTR